MFNREMLIPQSEIRQVFWQCVRKSRTGILVPQIPFIKNLISNVTKLNCLLEIDVSSVKDLDWSLDCKTAYCH